MSGHHIIVIGASAGGSEALKLLISHLPGDLDAAIFIVLHVSPSGPGLLPTILQRVTALPVRHAVDGEPIQRGHIYVAPPDRHLLIEADRVRVALGPRENLSRPAVDPLFRSAALAYGSNVVGVILSGRLDDGTAGLWAVKQMGGTTVVQDPEEADNPVMPRSALNYVAVDHCLPVAEIAMLLAQLAHTPATEGVKAVSKELRIESLIAGRDSALKLGVMDLGPLTPFTCPECHGALVQLKEGGIPRFRCHTGHAYSLSSLIADVSRSMETTLWNSLRVMEEGILLLKHMARHARDRQDIFTAEQCDQHAASADQRTRLIKQALQEHETLDPDLLTSE